MLKQSDFTYYLQAFAASICCPSVEHTNRSICTLEQQSFHQGQIQCFQNIGTQGQRSIIQPTITTQGTGSHKESFASLPLSNMDIKQAKNKSLSANTTPQ